MLRSTSKLELSQSEQIYQIFIKNTDFYFIIENLQRINIARFCNIICSKQLLLYTVTIMSGVEWYAKAHITVLICDKTIILRWRRTYCEVHLNQNKTLQLLILDKRLDICFWMPSTVIIIDHFCINGFKVLQGIKVSFLFQ